MKNRIIKISDGRVYFCANCPYCDRETGFCGFCMRKVLDDVKVRRSRKEEPKSEPSTAENGNTGE